MKYYKNDSNSVFAYSADGSQDDFIPKELEPIAEAEADLIRFPAMTSAQAWALIKAERDRRTATGGYQVPVAGVDTWFHSDPLSRAQQLGLVLAGAAIPDGLMWKTMDGSYVAMTAALASQVLAAATASDIATFTAAEVHRATMLAAAVPGDYDFSGDWPVSYGDVAV